MASEVSQEKNYTYYMESDLDSYTGEWVVIYQNKVLSHGKDIKKVVVEAKLKAGNNKFLIAKIPDKQAMLY